MNRGEGKIAWPTYLHACMRGDKHAANIDARMQVCSPQVPVGARMRVFVQFSTFRSMHACRIGTLMSCSAFLNRSAAAQFYRATLCRSPG